MQEQTKKAAVLTDPDVRRWYQNLHRGSANTGDVYLRRLDLFCRESGISPKKLPQLSKKALEDLVQDHVAKMEKQGSAPGYTQGMLKAVKSWLAHNDIKITRQIRVRNPNDTPTLVDEAPPTPQELKRILTYADERAKSGIMLVANAGVRLEALGNESGIDGLTIRDLPELDVKDGHVSFKNVPTIVIVRPELSKAGHKYFTFLTSEGCECLAAYLDKRLASGEKLHPPSPIITVTPGYEEKGKRVRNRGSGFVTTRNISRMIRRAIRPAFKWRPYVLRSYFDSGLMLAENRGKVSHSFAVFFMGHKGDMASRYSTHKGRLRDEDVEEMRSSFKKCQEFLMTSKPETETAELLAAFKKQLLLVSGFKESELADVDLGSLTDVQLQKMARQKLLGTLAAKGAGTIIVPPAELEDYLKRGYDYVDSPPALQGRAIIRLPN